MNADFVKTWILETPLEFDFEKTLGYLTRSSNECLFHVNDGRVTRCIAVGTDKPIVTVASEGDRGLRIGIMGIAPSRQPLVHDDVLNFVREWFDLGTVLAPFYEMASQDPLLRDPAERFYGLRLVGVPDLFEAVAWAVLGQQINLTFAYTLKRRLVEAFGESAAAADGERYWIFPSPEKIASLQVNELAGLQMTVKKAEYLIGAAILMTEGKLSKDKLLGTGSLAAAERELTGIHGIGPWTAHYVAMRCLRFTSAFPIQDVGLHLAMQKQLGWDRKPTIAEIRELARGWAGWESYATFFLWRTLY